PKPRRVGGIHSAPGAGRTAHEAQTSASCCKPPPSHLRIAPPSRVPLTCLAHAGPRRLNSARAPSPAKKSAASARGPRTGVDALAVRAQARAFLVRRVCSADPLSSVLYTTTSTRTRPAVVRRLANGPVLRPWRHTSG
ncbi:hypothetical protein FB451DRAFT_1560508, partial [Mycena latifolia]